MIVAGAEKFLLWASVGKTEARFWIDDRELRFLIHAREAAEEWLASKEAGAGGRRDGDADASGDTDD